MKTNEIPENVLLKAQEWLSGNYDDSTKAEVKKMMGKEDSSELIDAFTVILNLAQADCVALWGSVVTV